MVKRAKWVLWAGAALLLTACGGPSETEVASASVQVDPPQQASVTPQPPSSGLVCEDLPLVEIALGSKIDSEINDPIFSRCFWVEVPDGVNKITFNLTGLSDDLTLYLGYGYLITLQYSTAEVWRSGEEGQVDELLVLENPTPGPYFLRVGIGAPKAASTFALSVITEPEMTVPVTGSPLAGIENCAPPAAEVEFGVPISGEILAKSQSPEPRAYFCAQIPDGLGSISIDLTGLTGNLDLWVRLTRPAEWLDRSRGGETRSVVIENPAPGPYYIDVAGAHPGAGSPFTITVSSP